MTTEVFSSRSSRVGPFNLEGLRREIGAGSQSRVNQRLVLLFGKRHLSLRRQQELAVRRSPNLISLFTADLLCFVEAKLARFDDFGISGVCGGLPLRDATGRGGDQKTRQDESSSPHQALHGGSGKCVSMNHQRSQSLLNLTQVNRRLKGRKRFSGSQKDSLPLGQGRGCEA